MTLRMSFCLKAATSLTEGDVSALTDSIEADVAVRGQAEDHGGVIDVGGHRIGATRDQGVVIHRLWEAGALRAGGKILAQG